uniref:Uncharacterized protein n=1 Tax=Nelumbo nucifera TaxID=4432 RepID=A0A822XPX8_NELNU|nr:TPA_asm: hypothetical protein HUJ06_022704 [Nelumbo nucifera]
MNRLTHKNSNLLKNLQQRNVLVFLVEFYMLNLLLENGHLRKGVNVLPK